MEANELRTGNLFLDADGNVQRCVGLFFDTQEDPAIIYYGKGGEWTETFNPIPLTEEWMKKFEFNNSESKTVFTIKNGASELKILQHGFTKEFCFPYPINSVRRIKSVHELQNLYFALTGKELQYVN